MELHQLHTYEHLRCFLVIKPEAWVGSAAD
jgi:hypothetical protein